MEIWPKHAWFGITKRRLPWILLTIALMVCAPPLIIHLMNHPDPARIESERSKVLSAYLFSRGVDSPLTNCDPAKEVLVTEKSLSFFSFPSMFWQLPDIWLSRHWLSTPVINEFALSNLHSARVDTSAFQPPPVYAGVKVIPGTGRSESKDQSRLQVTFSQVAFRRDFSQAMFVTRVSCGSSSNTKYIYMARELKHGNAWYAAGEVPIF